MEEGRGNKLRLTLSQSKSSTLKICNNGFEQRISVLNDNSSIEAFPLNNGASGTNGEALWCSMFFEPCKKQSVSKEIR